MLKICAIISCRNEGIYLQTLLPYLSRQNIDVFLIDNESSDGSLELYKIYMGNPIKAVKTLKYKGYFSLIDQLNFKQMSINSLEYDWFIHQDADEILENFNANFSIRNAIEEADYSGYNVLNFEEFVFLQNLSNLECVNYLKNITNYYYFVPGENRLNRAWKNGANFSIAESGGHRLIGSGQRIFPVNHVLRHYIVLSYEHAQKKYLNRKFDPVDLAMGWHYNRLNFSKENLIIPSLSVDHPYLKNLNKDGLSRSNPAPCHFWEWPIKTLSF